MKVIGWKAWYTKNRVYRSTIDAWADIPKVGALFVKVFYEETHHGVNYADVLAGNRRYIMAIGSSDEIFLKSSLWKEDKLLDTYTTKPAWIKEGIWDDDLTVERLRVEVNSTITWK